MELIKLKLFRISLRSTCQGFHKLITLFLSENKYLTLSSSSPITSRTFQILTCNSRKLRHLDLSGCSWVTDEVIRPVLRSNPRLTSLDLSYCNNCTEGVLHTITMMCPSITRMLLRGCTWVNMSGLQYLCHQHKQRKQVVPLGLENVLKLMGTNLRTNVKERRKGKYSGKDQLYLHIQAKQMKMKSKINLKKTQPKNDTLHELDISECDFTISDSTVEEIAEVFSQLKVLKLAKNESVTDLAMIAIAKQLKHLHTLDIR